MKGMKKVASILLMLLLSISVGALIIKPTNAQSVPKPSMPEFTLKFTHAIWLNGTQQYDNNTIIVSIKNQQYSSRINGTNYQLSYDIRIKVHSAKDSIWTDLYFPSTYYKEEFTSYLQSRFGYVRNGTPVQSNSEYTVIPLTYVSPPVNNQGMSFPLAFNSTFDIQVLAAISHSTQGWVAYQAQSPVLGGQFIPVMSLDTMSNWSNTQTISISSNYNSPTPTPSVPEFSWLTILPILLAIPIVLIIARKRLNGNV